MKYSYKLSLSWPIMVLICFLSSYGCGFFSQRMNPIIAAACGIVAIVSMAAILTSAKLAHAAWMHARGRAIPLFEFVRDGEEVWIRGASPRMNDVGKTTLHLLVEKGVERMHCTVDAKAFAVPPFGDTYFKRVGDEMRYLRGF